MSGRRKKSRLGLPSTAAVEGSQPVTHGSRKAPALPGKPISDRKKAQLETPPLEGDLALERLFSSSDPDKEEDDDDAETKLRWVLPLIYDSAEEMFAAAVAEEEAGAETRRREAEEKAREAEEEKRRAEERERLKEEAVWRRKKRGEVFNSIRQYNPKTGFVEFTRFPFEDLSTFDPDEPSPIPAMRFTDKQIRDCARLNSMNALSVKIVSSDKGFPLDVYGNIILRDNLDQKCVHIFCRPSRMDSELIHSEDQSLILTGPSRGLVLEDYVYIEFDLKMKRDQGKDEQLSIGLDSIDGRMARRVPTTKVHHCTLESCLSTVDLRYAVVNEATEATVEFQVLQGDFSGRITAHTTKIEDSIHDRMVLYDDSACGAVTSSDGGSRDILRLFRRVVAVCVDETLVLTVKCEGVGFQKGVIDWGAYKLGVKVTWSVISF